MKPSALLVALSLSLLSGAAPSHAAVLPFTFTPDPTIGPDIEAEGTITTDDTPDEANIIAVSGTVDGVDITGIDPAGVNVLDTDTLAAFFAFTASADGVDYSLAFGPSAFAPYSLSMSGGDGPDLLAFGNLIVGATVTSPPGSPSSPVPSDPPISTQPTPPVSAVPLPASAPLFSSALLTLGALGYARKRRRAAAAA